MNPLPDAWGRQVALAEHAHVLVLIDGALQHELGRKLCDDPRGALSLLPDVEAEATALGPWLLCMDDASALGIDGAARGVNWLLSRLPLADAHAHLQPWTVGPLPNGTPKGYLRLADSRTLRALMTVWTPSQRMAFCAPWRAWCHADRDGRGALLALPAEREPHQYISPELDESQFQRLHQASRADQLLHQAKEYVTPHAATLSSRERRHDAAVALLEYARSIGYCEIEDQFALLLWVLRVGTEECRHLAQLPAVRQRLTGNDLWKQLHGAEATA